MRRWPLLLSMLAASPAAAQPAVTSLAPEKVSVSVFRDPGRGIYKRLVLENDRIIGVVMYGDTADGSWFYGLMKDGADIGPMRETRHRSCTRSRSRTSTSSIAKDGPSCASSAWSYLVVQPWRWSAAAERARRR